MLGRNSLLLVFLFVILIFVSACTTEQVEQAPQEVIDLATCINDNGVKMYGSVTCRICERERDLFGSAFEHLNEIECHPSGENPQTQLCLDKGIQKTPTWIKEENGVEVDRLEGYQDFAGLAEFSGCPWEE